MSEQEHRFKLRKLDETTGSYTEQAIFSVKRIDELQAQLSINVPDVSTSILIDGDQCNRIIKKYALDFSQSASTAELIHLHPDTVHDPNSHTGRELIMMLSGSKPFASFVEVFPTDSDLEIVPEKYFEPFVDNGQIKKIIHFEKSDLGSDLFLRYVFYALPGEEWRANAFVMLQGLTRKYGWNPNFEIVEGFLLGYETSPESGKGRICQIAI